MFPPRAPARPRSCRRHRSSSKHAGREVCSRARDPARTRVKRDPGSAGFACRASPIGGLPPPPGTLVG
ncbi:hypothetical protein Rumeso_00094 [Rubellimicrobium mesophilum DSM 19309]|uniref:Uncharacterized protein n=1 Tax=Rubellimicrobium mesophilum DSM 19309 TaxID=442562 RepID=A0A017HVA4_9RHOB|nr:hypothetical protein Rumeso_00094 [Rubellimicrobium mesophilum DSM 19309]